MKLSLVDVPDDYYKDELFFTDPEELLQIFAKLEEDNLSKILEQSEMAGIQEKLMEQEAVSRAILQSNFEEQARTRDEYQVKIKIAEGILAAIKRKSAQTMLFEPSGDTSTAKSGKAAAPVDYTKILNTLRDRIKTIHLTNKVGSGEVESKPTLQLLHEIESTVIRFIRNVARRRRKDDA